MAALALTVVPASGRPPAAPRTFTITGTVDGLYPGGSRTLELVVTNPAPFAVVVGELSVDVDDAGPDCLESQLTVPPLVEPVTVPASGTATVRLPATLGETAPDACQGATFPLTYQGTASRQQQRSAGAMSD